MSLDFFAVLPDTATRYWTAQALRRVDRGNILATARVVGEQRFLSAGSASCTPGALGFVEVFWRLLPRILFCSVEPLQSARVVCPCLQPPAWTSSS